MEQLHNGFTLQLCPGAFPLSTDSMALAHFARLPKQATVLDLGAGCGTLGLLLCAKDPRCHVTGLELDESAHAMALENARRNGIEDRFTSICADIRSSDAPVAPGSFSVCISNPPYFTGGPESSRTPQARKDDTCPIEALMAIAARALKFGGDFFLVHKPEKLAQLIACAAAHKLEAKRLCLLRHKAGCERAPNPDSFGRRSVCRMQRAPLLTTTGKFIIVRRLHYGRNVIFSPHPHRQFG